MLLARIISPVPEYSRSLAQDLRSRGYNVETVSPGEARTGAADLEITVEQCRPEDAGKLVAQVANSKDMCVFMAPQAASGKVRSVEVVVLKPSNQRAPEGVTAAQVIEFSSILLQEKPTAADPTAVEGKVSWRDTVISSADATWADISGTSLAWLRKFVRSARLAWLALREILLSWRACFLDIAQETARLGRRLAKTLEFNQTRANRASSHDPGDSGRERDIDEELVPSLFNLFPGRTRTGETLPQESLAEETPILRIRRLLATGFKIDDARRWRIAGAAAVVAIVLLLLVSLGPGPSVSKDSLGPSSETLQAGPERPPQATVAAPKTPVPVAASNLKRSAQPAARAKTAALSTRESIATPRRLSSANYTRDEETADDTVTRHTGTASKTSKAPQRYEVRHYSDLD